LKDIERTGECNQCGECCQKVRITSVLGTILRNHGSLDEARKYYSYRGITIAEVDKHSGLVMLEAAIPCQMLDENNRCKVHDDADKKPLICHKYPWFKDDIETCGFKFE
jgi:Fe-S-cluster containining protein